MKSHDPKKTISFIVFSLLLAFVACLFVWFCFIEPMVSLAIERNHIVSLFKESDFNISDDFIIVWTDVFNLNPYQFKDTDWYHWNIEIYNTHRPFENGWIELWLNIETKETLYVGELP